MRKRTLLMFFLALLAAASLAAAGEPALALHQVGAGVWAAISPDGGTAGSNAGFVIGDDGVAVIDSFINPAAAQELLGEIRKRTNLPVRFVVNTHYHLDHMAGNGVFAGAGAVVLANENVREWAHTENLKFFGAGITAEQRAGVEGMVLPSVVYGQGADLYLGKRKLVVRHLLGHTGSDSIVVVPDANVVFTGDLLWTRHLPNLIDASTGPWIQTLRTLATDYPTATFVPGHGEVGGPADLTLFGGYLEALRQAVAAALAQGKFGDSLAAAVNAALAPKYGSWGFFQHFLKPNTLQTAAELQGTKRLPGGKTN
ncbi:MAG TPA: MBL fold metallo-hydrolase [Candidatus Acidoferrales bacterium]|nr:MBL fold metallo-hydrolase [Candidatus Acidoferrales bacterium]